VPKADVRILLLSGLVREAEVMLLRGESFFTLKFRHKALELGPIIREAD
jgi:hypothetical protein